MRDILDNMPHRLDEKGIIGRAMGSAKRKASKRIGQARVDSGNAKKSAKGSQQVQDVDSYDNMVDAFGYTWNTWSSNKKDNNKWPDADRKRNGTKTKTVGNLALYLFGLGLEVTEIRDFFSQAKLDAREGLGKIKNHLDATGLGNQPKDTKDTKDPNVAKDTNDTEDPDDLRNILDSMRIPTSADRFMLLEFVVLLTEAGASFNLKSVADDFANWAIDTGKDYLGIGNDDGTDGAGEEKVDTEEFRKDLISALLKYGKGTSKNPEWVQNRLLPDSKMELLQKLNKLNNKDAKNPEEELNGTLINDEKNRKFIEFAHILLGMYKDNKEKYSLLSKEIMKAMVKAGPADGKSAGKEIEDGLKNYLRQISGPMKNNAYEQGTARKLWAFGYAGARYINNKKLYVEK